MPAYVPRTNPMICTKCAVSKPLVDFPKNRLACNECCKRPGRKPKGRTDKQQTPAQVLRVCKHPECKRMFWVYRTLKWRYCSEQCRISAPPSPRPVRLRTDPMVCNKCDGLFPLSEFPTDYRGEHLLRCKNCAQPSQETKRKSHLKTKFGMTLEEWEALYHSQNGLCAISKTPLPPLEEMYVVASKSTSWKYRNWNTDHCHKTGKVRGILCRQCNMGLGSFKDNPEVMRAAAEYIERHK